MFKRNNISIPKKIITLYISYIINPWLRNLKADFMLNNCLFGSAKLTKNADLDKCEYTGYSIGFDSRSEYLFTDRSMGKSHYLWSWSELTCICPYWLKK